MMTELAEFRKPYGAWIEDDGAFSFYLAHRLCSNELMLLAEEPPLIGRPVRLRLVVENEPQVISLSGRVIKHNQNKNEPSGFSVHFTDLEPQDRAFIDELIDEESYLYG